MSRTVVTPAARFSPPCHRSAWLCMSNRPGRSTRPAASISRSAPRIGASAGVTALMRPRRTYTFDAGPSAAFSLSNTRALRMTVRPGSGFIRRAAMSARTAASAFLCRASSIARLSSQPSSIAAVSPGAISAKRRGRSPSVAQTKVGCRPWPVWIRSCTFCDVPARVTSASSSRRWVSVPAGSSGSLPSGRIAAAAIETELASIVPFNGTYIAGPETLFSPRSDVEVHAARSPVRVNFSSTFAP